MCDNFIPPCEHPVVQTQLLQFKGRYLKVSDPCL